MNKNDRNIPPLVLVYKSQDTTAYYATDSMIEKTASRLRHFALEGALMNCFDGKERSIALVESVTKDEVAHVTIVAISVFIREVFNA